MANRYNQTEGMFFTARFGDAFAEFATQSGVVNALQEELRRRVASFDFNQYGRHHEYCETMGFVLWAYNAGLLLDLELASAAFDMHEAMDIGFRERPDAAPRGKFLITFDRMGTALAQIGDDMERVLTGGGPVPPSRLPILPAALAKKFG